ncbi:MAG: hypothetical protein CME60_13860 [Halobacteriovoraceae bacterium]|nr:hypothetical protein [Halobacteriovoraceae bacterium]|tara:strand:- start:682 stop:1101 length:420 start_codon:yes stop_codon:yes gene_type:complete
MENDSMLNLAKLKIVTKRRGKIMKKMILLVIAAMFSLNTMALSCHGTEPFWGAEITKDLVSLDFIGEGIKEIPITEVHEAAGFVSGFVTTFSSGGKPVAVTTSNKCNNSMSDHIFPKEVIIFLGETVLYGCCGEGVIPQ